MLNQHHKSQMIHLEALSHNLLACAARGGRLSMVESGGKSLRRNRALSAHGNKWIQSISTATLVCSVWIGTSKHGLGSARMTPATPEVDPARPSPVAPVVNISCIPGNYQSRKASATIVFHLQEQLVIVLGYPRNIRITPGRLTSSRYT
jgi:hypothetical protein